MKYVNEVDKGIVKVEYPRLATSSQIGHVNRQLKALGVGGKITWTTPQMGYMYLSNGQFYTIPRKTKDTNGFLVKASTGEFIY